MNQILTGILWASFGIIAILFSSAITQDWPPGWAIGILWWLSYMLGIVISLLKDPQQ